MRCMLAFALALTSVGCGSREPIIDKEFQSYYQEFMEITRGMEYTHVSHIRFANAGDKYMEGRAGVCLYSGIFPDGTVQFENEIRISKGYWNRLSDGSRALVVFHELVHCSLGYTRHDSSELMGTTLESESYTREQAREMLEGWLATH